MKAYQDSPRKRYARAYGQRRTVEGTKPPPQGFTLAPTVREAKPTGWRFVVLWIIGGIGGSLVLAWVAG